MGLYQEMAQASTAKGCKMSVIMREMSADDVKDINMAFANSEISSNAIFRVLKNHGYDIGYTALHKHRIKDCACVNL